MKRPKYVKEVITYLEDSPNIEDRSTVDYIYKLEDELHKHNVKIKKLKNKIEDLLDTEMNPHGETLRIILNR